MYKALVAIKTVAIAVRNRCAQLQFGVPADCGDNQAPIHITSLGKPQAFLMSSTSNFEVRPATLRDAKAIAEIHVSASLAAYRGLLTDVQINTVSAEQRQAYWREAIEFNEPQVYVAVDEGEVVGFVGFDRSRDPGTPPTTGEIWSIFAATSHWGRGVGLALWDVARDGLLEEGCTKVTLWVPLGNERGLRFHELAGFKRELASAKTVPLGAGKIEEIRLKRELS